MRTDARTGTPTPTDRPRVIHTGQALVDEVIEVPGLPARGQNVMATSVAQYAGGAVTVLLAAARLGADCVHAGAHGTGPHGDLIRAALAADGIAASAPPVPGRDTGVCVVLVEPSAERTFVTTLGAERDITVESLATAEVQPGDLVCVTGYSLAVAATRDPLLAWLDQIPEGAVVVLDPGAAFATMPAAVRDTMLAHTDVWTSNAEEATDLLAALGTQADTSDAGEIGEGETDDPESAARESAERESTEGESAEREVGERQIAARESDERESAVREPAARESAAREPAAREPDEREISVQTRALLPVLREGAVVIVRDGAEGCAVHAAGRTTYVPGFPQIPVDTNGAGDTHTGALLADIAMGESWVDACIRANAAAAIKVTRRGPTTAPTADEVDAFLRAAEHPIALHA